MSQTFLVESPDGNPTVDVKLEGYMLTLPEGAFNAKIKLVQCTSWNTAPNIREGDNQVTIKVGDDPPFTVAIPPGQYDIDTFEGSIVQELKRAGKDPKLLYLYGDTASSRVYFLSSASNVEVRFSERVCFILGINYVEEGAHVSLALANVPVLAPSRAVFNLINSFRVRLNIAGKGLSVNGLHDGILAEIPLIGKSGRINQFLPVQPYEIDFDMSRLPVRQFQATLLDNNNEKVYTGEYWSCIFVVTWEDPSMLNAIKTLSKTLTSMGGGV